MESKGTEPPFNSTSQRSPQAHEDLTDLERFIESALAYEKVLAKKQYFLRKLILTALVKRNHLAALAESLRRMGA